MGSIDLRFEKIVAELRRRTGENWIAKGSTGTVTLEAPYSGGFEITYRGGGLVKDGNGNIVLGESSAGVRLLPDSDPMLKPFASKLRKALTSKYYTE